MSSISISYRKRYWVVTALCWGSPQWNSSGELEILVKLNAIHGTLRLKWGSSWKWNVSDSGRHACHAYVLDAHLWCWLPTAIAASRPRDTRVLISTPPITGHKVLCEGALHLSGQRGLQVELPKGLFGGGRRNSAASCVGHTICTGSWCWSIPGVEQQSATCFSC